jgi:hypothetical protein
MEAGALLKMVEKIKPESSHYVTWIVLVVIAYHMWVVEENLGKVADHTSELVEIRTQLRYMSHNTLDRESFFRIHKNLQKTDKVWPDMDQSEQEAIMNDVEMERLLKNSSVGGS